MIQLSKLNLILIIITTICVVVTIFTVIESRKIEPEIKSSIEAVAESNTEPEPTSESEAMAAANAAAEFINGSSTNIFDKSLDSPETGEFVKSLIKEDFYNKTVEARDGKLHRPFDTKIILQDTERFDYETIVKVIDNLQLVTCSKYVTRLSKVGYNCGFILPSVVDTLLNAQANQGARNFEALVVLEENGYSISFE